MSTLKMVLHVEITLKTTIQKKLPKSQKFARKISVVGFRFNQTIFLQFTVILFHSNLDEKITSNEQKVTSNEHKVTSNEQKLTRNEQKLTSNEQKLTSKEQKLTSNEQKVTSNEQKLTSNEREVSSLQRFSMLHRLQLEMMD